MDFLNDSSTVSASKLGLEDGLNDVMERLNRLHMSIMNMRLSFKDTFRSHILPNGLLFDRILDFASPGTLVCLSKTCHYAQDAVNHYIPRAFDINKALSRYFTNPLTFRSLQAATSTLISGSSALQFLGRFFYSGSDLDLYCDRSSRVALGEYLLDEGYTFVPNSRQDPAFHVAATQPVPAMNTRGLVSRRLVT